MSDQAGGQAERCCGWRTLSKMSMFLVHRSTRLKFSRTFARSFTTCRAEAASDFRAGCAVPRGLGACSRLAERVEQPLVEERVEEVALRAQLGRQALRNHLQLVVDERVVEEVVVVKAADLLVR